MSQTPQVFVTADTHFGHENILKYEHRPFPNVHVMDKRLIGNWNSVVGKNDIVYVLGDCSFHTKADTEKIIKKLNGQTRRRIYYYQRHKVFKPKQYFIRKRIT